MYLKIYIIYKVFNNIPSRILLDISDYRYIFIYIIVLAYF